MKLSHLLIIALCFSLLTGLCGVVIENHLVVYLGLFVAFIVATLAFSIELVRQSKDRS